MNIPSSLEKLHIFKSFKKSPYRSTKHLSYFHTYTELFEKYRGKSITFMEIGILDGGSLFMWRDFFGKKAKIIGIELNPKAKKWKKDGFEIYTGSQSDELFWKKVFKKIGKVDIVLDDGGHTNEQQIITAHSCLPYINDGGLFVTEDTHTSYMTKFGNPSKYSFIQWTKVLVDNINSRCSQINLPKLIYKDYIQSIRYFESIVCLEINRKKCIDSHSIENGGKSLNSKDLRLQNSGLENIFFKSRYRHWLHFKLKNLKLRKFFKKDK